MYPVIDDEFLKNRPLSYSSLKAFRQSPKHYLEYLISPRVPSDAMVLGSAVEKLLLYDRSEFDREFRVYELSSSRRTKAGAEEWEQLVANASANKLTLLTREMFEEVKVIVAALRDSIELKPFLDGIVRRRQRLSWTDTGTQLPLIGYTDWDAKVAGQLFIVDLKVMRSSDPEDFAKDAFKYDYPIQIGSYLQGYKYTKYAFPEFLFVVAESSAPYNVTLMRVDDAYKEYCTNEFLGTLRAFRYCLNHNLFSQGYEFRLMGLMPFFGLDKPAWGKVRFGEYNCE